MIDIIKCPECNGTGKTTTWGDADSEYECVCLTCKGSGKVIKYKDTITNDIKYKNI